MANPKREPSEFGKRLRLFRLSRGLSQTRLAEIAGVPRPCIAFVEDGRNQGIVVQNAVKLADALGTTVDRLTRGDPLEERGEVRV